MHFYSLYIPQACLHSHSCIYRQNSSSSISSFSPTTALTSLHTQLIFKPNWLRCIYDSVETNFAAAAAYHQKSVHDQIALPRTPFLSWGSSVVMHLNDKEAWSSLGKEMECNVYQKPCKYGDQWWKRCKSCAFKQTATPNPAWSQWYTQLSTINCPSISTREAPTVEYFYCSFTTPPSRHYPQRGRRPTDRFQI